MGLIQSKRKKERRAKSEVKSTSVDESPKKEEVKAVESSAPVVDNGSAVVVSSTTTTTTTSVVVEPKKTEAAPASTTVSVVAPVASTAGPTEQVVKVPKKRQNLIIGAGGATIKDIRSQTGADVQVPKDDSEDVVVKGDAQSVSKAVAMIQKILAEKEAEREKKHKDLADEHEAASQATGKIFDKYKVRIDEAAKKRTQLHEEANVKYEAGDKGEAARLREEAKEQTTIMETLQAEASNEVFAHLNEKYTDNMTIDLHGQYVEPAMALLKKRIAENKAAGKTPLLVIYGAGNHSDAAGAKIKPAVRKYLEEEGLTYTEVNNGSVSVPL